MKKSESIKLDLPPVGVEIITDDDPALSAIPRFTGISYCEAVLQATFGRELIVDSSSIQVCQWAPVVLGFKKPENEFERSINTHLPAGTASLLLAPIARFTERRKPDVVIIRAQADTYRSILEILGYDKFIPFREYNRDETALAVFSEEPLKGFPRWAISNVNRWLSWMNRFSWWQGVTTFLFRSTTVSRIFDRFITKYMANMSLCRNSTVIPYQTGRANISFFCTGGIAWGKNFPDFMTSGFPYKIYREIEGSLLFPGVPGFEESERYRRLRNETIGNAGNRTEST